MSNKHSAELLHVFKLALPLLTKKEKRVLFERSTPKARESFLLAWLKILKIQNLEPLPD